MRIHFIGICGYAVSGLALVAKQLGNDVTGSDEDAYPPTTDILTNAGIKWVDGHAAGNVTRWGKPDQVVQGNQVREGNPETEAARRLHIRLVSEAEYWGELTADRFRIVVAGSAGKTTTASLLAWILRSAGRNPGFRLGSSARDLGSAAAWGSGRECVVDRDVQMEGEGMRFTAWHAGKVLAVVTTRLTGEHNASNALAALATSVRLGVPVASAVDAIGRFQGVARRFELRRQVRGVTLVDDYAHHPAKVRATVQAALERFHPGRVLACFVPHTYSRTLSLIDGYADAFAGCALVVIGPIEPARERHLVHTVSSQDLANRIRGVEEVVTADSARSAAYKLASAARPGDAIVFMSVRDFDDVIGKTVEVLERSPVA